MLIPSHLSDSALAALTDGAAVLEKDSHGPKVYRLADGRFLKLFRRKRLISSAALRPYSMRFCLNAERLVDRGIPTLQPLALYKLSDRLLSAVLYRPLAGKTLKEVYLDEPEAFCNHLPQLAQFIRELHRKGVYFRSLHLGNIVLTPEGALGLIDIADLTVQPRPLPKTKARRNLAHFSRLLDQMGIRDQFPFAELSEAVLSD
ncbi:toluene tolerance protein [Pseudomonas stutzeri]|uniref:lipopolysaccharide kinase InaA family protein n=1 Tax=Stutzerimonas stutzeri TaxID=316 RepID=UPI001F5206F0|nr:lipopolysaccharide kinase InaA family protein [Stutzerimonas stutzeri]MCI0918825.1 toluene tolerance protein [Stutzerimonas stutzeri]